MDTSLFCVYVLLQMVLAPMLYPFGYLLQAVVVILNSWRRQSYSETESMLLEPLLLSLLICSLVLTEGISLSGYAVRIGVLLARLYFSRPLFELTQAILDPLTSCFLLAELIASPHLYPTGYLAQLGVIVFLYISGTLQQFSGPLSSKNRKKNWQRYLERSRTSVPKKSSHHGQNTSHGQQSDGESADVAEVADPADEEFLCKICFEHPVSSAFLSCGHVCCRQCADYLCRKSLSPDVSSTSTSTTAGENTTVDSVQCPFCKANVWRRVDLYFP